MQTPLTRGQQTGRVAFLGIAFMIMFTAFNSLQNIVSKLYEDYGYGSLGQAAVLCIYLSFAICTFFSSFIIKNYGYKKVMFVSSLGYAVFQLAGLIIALQFDIPKAVGWIIIIAGAVLCGASASVIWVAQGAYVSKVAGQRSTQLFGLFWSLMMSSQILGNLITTFVLGLIGNVAYFLSLTILGASSAFLFLLLPDVSSQEDGVKVLIKQQFQKIVAIIKDKKYRYLNIYYLFPGLCVAFYAAFLYKLIGLSVKQGDMSKDDYDRQLSFYSGLVFITLGVSQAITGILMNRFGQRFCKFKLAIVGTLMVEAAGFVSFVCYFLESFPLCFVASFLWGSSETFIQTNTGALISKIFPGRVESFSVYRIIFGLGVVFTILLSIALKEEPSYIFLTLVMVAQVLITGVSFNLSNLNTDRDTLLTNRDEQDQIPS